MTDDFWDEWELLYDMLTAVIIGHHLFVKETGLIVTCFHWGILESAQVNVERQTV